MPPPRWPKTAVSWTTSPCAGRGAAAVSASALLLEEFRALAARGVTVVRLFVDAQNATGAVALYERAGMRVARRFNVVREEACRARSAP